MSVKKPHKQAELIKAWADGAEIQCKNCFGEWVEIDLPLWYTNTEYRIKPEPRDYWLIINQDRQVFGPFTKEEIAVATRHRGDYRLVKEVKKDDKD